MTATFPYSLTPSKTPALGLIVLSVDETLETEFRHFVGPRSARVYVSRMPSGAVLTSETLDNMAENLGQAAALLPNAVEFTSVAFACTSGAAHLGNAKLRALISAHVNTRAITDPLTAVTAQIAEKQLLRVGLISPYIEDVANTLRQALAARGVTISASLSFGEKTEARVARIDPASIAEAARNLCLNNELDGVFISCTNLRTAEILPRLQAELNVPLISSNSALAWHMTRPVQQPNS